MFRYCQLRIDAVKAALRLDQDADVSTMPDSYRSKLKFRPENGQVTPYYPKGTEFEGEHALLLVKNGQANPIDAECAAAAGMSPAQLEAKQREYLAASAGIRGKKDMDMFMTGAIEGYGPGTTDDVTVYIHGPNWDAWQSAEEQAKAAITKDVI